MRIFIIRIILGVAIAVVLSRLFYPQANIAYAIGLAVVLVGMAYLAEFLRLRKENKDRGNPLR